MDCSDDDFNYSSKEVEFEKLPFKRLELALNQVTKTAIPFHVQLLKEQSIKIKKFKLDGNQLHLHSEQIKAANTVRLLKSDLHELETINAQVKEEDGELFQRQIESPTRDAIEVLSEFMELHSDVLQPFPEIEDSDESLNFNNTKLVCDFKQDSSSESSDIPPAVAHYMHISDIQCEIAESNRVLKHWTTLKRDLREVNELVRKFASLVFSQKPQVDSIESNILQSRENIEEGTRQLSRAVIFKTASIPIAGAVIGGILLGPVGALVGLKLAGTAVFATGGGILGYSVGCKVKKAKLETLNFEMKALTYPSKVLSRSTPELSLGAENMTSSSEKKED